MALHSRAASRALDGPDSGTSLADRLDRLRRDGRNLTVWGTSARAEQTLADAPATADMVLALGSETRGMSQAVRALCDAIVSIPMSGEATSLNVTSAGAIVLHEMRRRRDATLESR